MLNRETNSGQAVKRSMEGGESADSPHPNPLPQGERREETACEDASRGAGGERMQTGRLCNTKGGRTLAGRPRHYCGDPPSPRLWRTRRASKHVFLRNEPDWQTRNYARML